MRACPACLARLRGRLGGRGCPEQTLDPLDTLAPLLAVLPPVMMPAPTSSRLSTNPTLPPLAAVQPPFPKQPTTTVAWAMLWTWWMGRSRGGRARFATSCGASSSSRPARCRRTLGSSACRPATPRCAGAAVEQRGLGWTGVGHCCSAGVGLEVARQRGLAGVVLHCTGWHKCMCKGRAGQGRGTHPGCHSSLANVH